jgi:hypothetical protein
MCTGFAALARANTKFQRGYASTDIDMAIDVQHGFMQPNGIEDLQKGERYATFFLLGRNSTDVYMNRYCNIDYIVASTLFQF